VQFENGPVSLVCPLDFFRQKAVNLGKFTAHLKGHIKEGTAITCPFQKCGKTFHLLSTFTAHVPRSHKHWDVLCIDGQYKADGQQQAPDMCESERAQQIDDCTENAVSFMDCTDDIVSEQGAFQSLLHKLALWLMNLEAKFHILSSTIQAIMAEFRDIQDISSNIMIDRITKKFSGESNMGCFMDKFNEFLKCNF
jgi:hypothetical protein